MNTHDSCNSIPIRVEIPQTFPSCMIHFSPRIIHTSSFQSFFRGAHFIIIEFIPIQLVTNRPKDTQVDVMNFFNSPVDWIYALILQRAHHICTLKVSNRSGQMTATATADSPSQIDRPLYGHGSNDFHIHQFYQFSGFFKRIKPLNMKCLVTL